MVTEGKLPVATPRSVSDSVVPPWTFTDQLPLFKVNQEPWHPAWPPSGVTTSERLDESTVRSSELGLGLVMERSTDWVVPG